MNQEDNTPKLYTAKQIAEILQVQPNYIYMMCRHDLIPYVNIAPIGSIRPMYRFNLQDVLNHWKLNETDVKNDA